MRLTYVSSACTVIEYNGVKVLTDPWLVDGAYMGAWYHNPPLTVQPEDFHDCQYIYLSHIHPDHTDLATLKRLNKQSVVLLAPYVDDYLRKIVEGRKFPVRVLDHGVPYPLAPDFTIEIRAADNCNPQACGQWIGCPVPNVKDRTAQIDSLAVFAGGGKTIWNTNDCPYRLASTALCELHGRYGRPDLLCVGYGGAGPYPQCFPGVNGTAEASRKMGNGLEQMAAYLSALTPKRYLPFAGQYWLAGKLGQLNKWRGVPELEDLHSLYGDDPRMVLLNRSGWYDFDTEAQDAPFRPVPLHEKLSYDMALRQRRMDYEDDPMPTAEHLADAFDAAVQSSTARWARRHLHADWAVHFGPERNYGWFTVPLGSSPTKSLQITLDARLFLRLLTRRAHWNQAEVGSHLTYHRTPDTYERTPYHMLCYFHQ